MIKSMQTSQGTITIRDASLADAEKFRDLRLFALKESPLAFGADYETDRNRPPEYWPERLQEDEYSVMFVAEHEHTLVGMTGIICRPLPKTKHSGKIIAVFVHPEWRGLRIAKSLIDACIRWARSKGIIIVKLSVNAENVSAIRCYERCGFTIYGTEPMGIFYNGKYYDGYLMSKSLGDHSG
jgi:RimJ/RimL family protein N-acetyltransferase